MNWALSLSPLALASGRSLGGLLLVGLVGVLWAQRHTPDRLWRSVLFQRWLSWLGIALLAGAATLLGPLPLGALLAACAWQGTREYARLHGAEGGARRGLLLLAVATPLLAALGAPLGLLALLGLAGLGALGLRRGSPERAQAELGGGLLGYLWIPWGLAHLAALGAAQGPELPLLLASMVALSDVGAFLFGHALGGPRLAPAISPNKTWAGVAGNAAGAAVALALLPFAVPAGWSLARLAALAGLVAGAAVLGDLLESQLKRSAGVKDAGRLLPGFGGLLDRMDSLLLAAPAAYWFVSLA